MKKVLLCGYMGCGKSTVAQILSHKTDLPQFDLDDLIEKNEGMSIPEIFEKNGEVYFRKLEHRLFTQLMGSPDDFILALGGGTPAYANNHLLMNGEGVTSFFLRASIETLHDRLIDENENRPLVAGKASDELKEHIAKHLFDRNYYYNQATYTVVVDGKSAEQVADEILEKLA
ncbi:shikimate kinase [Flavobacterium sp. MAH-1]|uniref:Shikimate kinase n=1 Tax=Flavobacterium agri TaxID=2743471 RepID=A0A7Y8Y5C2_9FLAO|nr:shikimate kinase [Flavobacterium agri]NUY82674.1 shikimate kinase [Flavobacterium agri]NYA72697.1 shikimate kinase [Flavobacterium agri]